MKPDTSKNVTISPSIQQRQARMVDLLAKGYSVDGVAKELNCNRVTVWRDRKQIGESDIVDAMISCQLREIDQCKKEELRLEYRNKLIGIMRPHRIDAKVEGEVKATGAYAVIDGKGNAKVYKY